MTPDQEIRAEAIKAAAALCAPVSPVDDQQIPNVEDVLFVADVFKGYIDQGWEEALRLHSLSGTQQAPSVRTVELREQQPVEDVPLPEQVQTSPGPTSAPEPAVEPTPEPAIATKVPKESMADIIPIEARGTVTKEQGAARRMVDRIRYQRAEQLFKQAQVAKSEDHKQRLRDEMEGAGLANVVISIEGRKQELGQYLASL